MKSNDKLTSLKFVGHMNNSSIRMMILIPSGSNLLAPDSVYHVLCMKDLNNLIDTVDTHKVNLYILTKVCELIRSESLTKEVLLLETDSVNELLVID